MTVMMMMMMILLLLIGFFERMKQALTESGENDVDMESKIKTSNDETEGSSATNAKQIQNSYGNDSDNYGHIKQEPTGSDENEGAVKHTDDDNNYNDEHDSILPTSRYPPSPTFSFSPAPFPSTSTSFSLSPQSSYGGESSRGKIRHHHHKRHRRHRDDFTGEHSSSHKKKKKKNKKNRRTSSPEKQENREWFPVKIKQEPAW